MGSGSGGGVGPGRGYGVGPGTAYNTGGGTAPQGAGAKPIPGPPSAGQPLPSVETSSLNTKGERLSPEDLKRREILSKLHPSLAAIVERLMKKVAEPGPQEETFVVNGKAAVQVWLNDTSKESIAPLKQLGFEILLKQKSTKLLIGWLPIEKLEALANLKAVRYIAPVTTSN